MVRKVRAAWHARSPRARRGVAHRDRDGPVRKRFSDRTVVVRLAERPVKCVSCVHLCHVSSCPAGRRPPAAHGTWSSQSVKQPSPRCSRNDPRTLLIALTQDGLGQPSCLVKLLSGPKTAPAACHVAALRLAAGGAGTGPERRAARPTDRPTVSQTAAAVLTCCAWLFAG